MAYNTCEPARIHGPMVQTLFMGCTIKSFSASIGWNEQASNLTVNLVEDPCSGLKIHYDQKLDRQSGIIKDFGFPTNVDPGTPVYFRIEEDPRNPAETGRRGFEYCGLIQSFSQSHSANGNPEYTVQLTDPRIILQNTQVIVNDFIGATSGVFNLINAFGYIESNGLSGGETATGPLGPTSPYRFGAFGNSEFPNLLMANDRGMVWTEVRAAIHELTAAINKGPDAYAQGGRLVYVGTDFQDGFGVLPKDRDAGGNPASEYLVDLSDMPFAPADYRISGPNVSLMEIISQVCEDAGMDYYVELIPIKNAGKILKIIKIRVSLKTSEVGTERLTEFIEEKKEEATAGDTGGVLNFTKGKEVRNETTSMFLMGGQNRDPYSADNTMMLPFWGYDINGDLHQATVVDGEYAVSVDVRRLNTTLTTPIASNYAVISESEMRAVLGDMDTWKHVTHVMQNTIATHFATIKQPKFISPEKLQQAADGQVPAMAAMIPNFAANSDEIDPKSDSAKDFNKIYEFVRSYADEFYGKQFLVSMPFVKAAIDGGGNTKFNYLPSTEGCWPLDAQVLGLTTNPATAQSDFFRSDDGRLQGIIRYPATAGFTFAGGGGSLVPDPSKLGDDNYITDGSSHIWVKADVSDKWVRGTPYGGGPEIICALMKVGSVLTNKESDDDTSNGVDVNQAGANFLAKKAGGAGLPPAQLYIDRSTFTLSMLSYGISPNAAAVPCLSNIQCYGPWGIVGDPGQVRLERDDGLVPWEYGGDAPMYAAAVSKLEAINMRKGERGSIALAGYPPNPLGSELKYIAGLEDFVETRTPDIELAVKLPIWRAKGQTWDGSFGPAITNVNVQVGAQGFTTDFQFSTYTPRFGRFNKNNAERIKAIGQQRLLAGRNLRSRQALSRQIAAATARIKQRIETQVGKTARAPKSSSHLLMGRMLEGRNESFTINAKEATLTFPTDATYAESALMSMDGIFRPVSKAGDGGLPRFVNHTDSTCSGNVEATIAPDGPKLSYSGLKINQSYLDPFTNPSGLVANRTTTPASGHDIEVLGRNTSAPPSGWCIAEGEEAGDGGYADDYRFFALRGPLVLQSWGYDTDGKPVPNDADSQGNAEAGTFTTSNLKDKFLDKFLKLPKTWPVAPVDLRLDRKRGVWTVPPAPRNLHITYQQSCPTSSNIKANVNNGQNTFNDAGVSVTQEANVEWPWEIKPPIDVGKIPAYWDTSDCKYYAFPTNRLDATINGYVDRTNDIKHIVFASGFAGSFVDVDGCDRTLFVSASGVSGIGSGVLAGNVPWTECFEGYTECLTENNFPSTEEMPLGCSTKFKCLKFGHGLTLNELPGEGELKEGVVEAWQFISDVTDYCGSETVPTTGACNSYYHLLAGSGLVVEEKSADCRYAIHSQLIASGNRIANHCDPYATNFPPRRNIVEGKKRSISFVGGLSSVYDTANCEFQVSGIKPTINFVNSGTCPKAGRGTPFRGETLVAGSGLEFVQDECSGIIHSKITASGYGIETCDIYKQPRFNPAQRRFENLNFRGNLSSTYSESDCSVTVSGVPVLRMGISGVCDQTEGEYPFETHIQTDFFAEKLVVASGLSLTQDECTGILKLHFGVSGQPTECPPEGKASTEIAGLITGIAFSSGIAISEPKCGLITVKSRQFVSGLATCRTEEKEGAFFTGLRLGTGLVYNDPYAPSDCQLHRKDIHVQIFASGSNFAGQDGCSDNYDPYNRNTVFKKAFETIIFTGNLASEYDINKCAVVVSGAPSPMFFSGLPVCCYQGSDCANREVDKFTADTLVVGTGLYLENNKSTEFFTADDQNCTALIQSNIFATGSKLPDNLCEPNAREESDYVGPKDSFRKRFENIEFKGYLDARYKDKEGASDLGCLVTVSGSRTPLRFFSSGVCSENGGTRDDAFLAETFVVSKSGLTLTEGDDPQTCTGILTTNLQAKGYEKICLGESASLSDFKRFTNIVFGTGLKMATGVCHDNGREIHVNSNPNWIYGLSDCDGDDGAARDTFTGLGVGSGITLTKVGDCAYKLMSDFSVAGTKKSYTCQTLSSTTVFSHEKPITKIEFVGGLSTTAKDGEDCTAVVSGISSNTINVESINNCDLIGLAVGRKPIQTLQIGRGLSFVDNDACTGIISSLLRTRGQKLSEPFCDPYDGTDEFDETPASRPYPPEIITFTGFLSSTWDMAGTCRNLIVSGSPSPVVMKSIETCNNSVSVSDFNAAKIIVGTGLQLKSSGTCGATLNANIQAQGQAYYSTCLPFSELILPANFENPFESKVFDNIKFGGYLSSYYDEDSCTVKVTGLPTPIFMFQSGTCPNDEDQIQLNPDVEGAGVTGIAVGTGLSVDFDGCFARLNSSMLLSRTGSCDIEVTDDDTYNPYTHLIFRSGIRSTQRTDAPEPTPCHYYIDANQFISNTGVCGREPADSLKMSKDRGKNHFDNLILGTGLVASLAKRTIGGGGRPSTDEDILCAFRIDSAMKILSQDFCGSNAVPETNYEKLNFSGLHVELESDCQYLIKHEQNLKTDNDCVAAPDGSQDTLPWTNEYTEATPFKSLIFGRGIRVEQDGSSCDYKITAGMRIKAAADCNDFRDQTGGYRTYVNLIIGSGFTTSRPDDDDCTFRLDPLTMGAAGCNIAGQTINCGQNILPGYVGLGCDPGLTACDLTTPYENRSVPDLVNAFVSGPGIGFASPQSDSETDSVCGALTIFNNHNDVGLEIGAGCDDEEIQISQVYQHNWGRDFAISALGVGITRTDGTVECDGTAITEIEISDADEDWSMCVVTGITTETTVIDGQTVVTAVYPLSTIVGGMKTCGDKYLITTLSPPVGGASCQPGPSPPPGTE